ncbi:MAG: lysophospholipase L1-like esterase [Planctomycetota bacterium]|jgi:lysophospholipase L1-like esterase
MESTKKIKVLCFGDSNTWGRIPGGDRYDQHTRWTGVVQDRLGEGYEVLEEGLSARTTNIDEEKFFKNGYNYFVPYIVSHADIDMVVLMLGTSDCKERYGRTPQEIASGVEEYMSISKELMPEIRFILVAPAPIHEDSLRENRKDMFRGGESISQELRTELAKIATKYELPFVDAAAHVAVSREDGLHLDEDAHHLLGETISSVIQAMV